jgi:capsid protein
MAKRKKQPMNRAAGTPAATVNTKRLSAAMSPVPRRARQSAARQYKAVTQKVQAKFGRQPANWYDATRDSKRRRSPSLLLMSEDRVLLPFARRRMVGTARDLRRNFSIAAWAIRKTLDFISTFSFHARSGNDDANAMIEEFVEQCSGPLAFDVAARHGRQAFTRLLTACSLVDGDCGSVPISNGSMQAIEGDRIRTPWDQTALESEDRHFVHGVLVNGNGRAIQYAVCKRSILGTSMELDRMVPARYMWMLGWYDRFDQVRGITPLASALNEFQDLYEARVYALAKAKIAQLFGIKFTRKESDPITPELKNLVGADSPTGPAGDEDHGEGEPDHVEDPPPPDYASVVRIAYEDEGVPMLDMDPGDDAGFMENKTPSVEFQQFDERIICSALKSLDMPMWFYDEARTNFFGSKGALQQYVFGCQVKRENVRSWLHRWTAWRVGKAIAEGELKLPRGVEYPHLKWEWVAAGLPWWQPLEEVRAQAESIRLGTNSTPAACKETGTDAYRIVDEQCRYQIYRANKAKEVYAAGGRMPEDMPTQVSETIKTDTETELETQQGESGKQTSDRHGSKSNEE